MIIFKGLDNTASIIYDETTLTEEQKNTGLKIEALPEAPTLFKHQYLVLKTDLENAWYDVVNIIDVVDMNDLQLDINKIGIIDIAYKKYDEGQYILNDSVSKSVEVYINNELQGETEIINGIGSIEFQSEIPDTYKITVDNFTCEVVVNGN